MAKTVVAISSFVMRGAVGLRAAQFALERRGDTVWPVPTVLMPWHPGLGRSTRTVPADLPAQLAELSTRAAEVDAVLTGYFATAETVAAAARLIDAVRAARSDAIVLVDPVIGDERGRYVPDPVAEAIASLLVPRADILTPNAHELADLSGGSDAAAARRLGPPAVVVTSAVAEGGRIAALLVDDEGEALAEHDAVRDAPRGTGDLFAAVLLSARLSGRELAGAVREAAAATLAVVRASGPETLALAAAQDLIAAPPADTVAVTR
jgi:pyridoxine kinase